MLPDGSGWTLLPQIRDLNPPPALIVLSGDEPTPEQKSTIRASLTKSGHSTTELLALLQTLSNKAPVASPGTEVGRSKPGAPGPDLRRCHIFRPVRNKAC